MQNYINDGRFTLSLSSCSRLDSSLSRRAAAEGGAPPLPLLLFKASAVELEGVHGLGLHCELGLLFKLGLARSFKPIPAATVDFLPRGMTSWGAGAVRFSSAVQPLMVGIESWNTTKGYKFRSSIKSKGQAVFSSKPVAHIWAYKISKS